jgi:hypothetical protein
MQGLSYFGTGVTIIQVKVDLLHVSNYSLERMDGTCGQEACFQATAQLKAVRLPLILISQPPVISWFEMLYFFLIP